jgi:hypothetical protein
MKKPTVELTPIVADAAYPIELFGRATGLGNWALRQARRTGLRIRVVGRRRYVIGADWIEFLSHAPTDSKPSNPAP